MLIFQSALINRPNHQQTKAIGRLGLGADKASNEWLQANGKHYQGHLGRQ